MARNQQARARKAPGVLFSVTVLLAVLAPGIARAGPPDADGWRSSPPASPPRGYAGTHAAPSETGAGLPPSVVRGALPEAGAITLPMPPTAPQAPSSLLPPLQAPLTTNPTTGIGLLSRGLGTAPVLAAAPPVPGKVAEKARPEGLPRPAPLGPKAAPAGPGGVHAPNAPADGRLLPIDLPYALRLVSASNPTIALARERIQQAYAIQQGASVMWVPNIWLGGNPHAAAFLPAFFHHDGLIQNADGRVFFTDRNDFFLQAGASLDISLADTIFAPRITRRQTQAVAAQARVVDNDVQLQVALAYLDLLQVYGALAINDEALRNVQVLVRFAESAENRGLGQPADANQARAELVARQQERAFLQTQAAMTSARLAQLLLLDPTVDLLPADQTVLPIALVPNPCSLDELIALGLTNRPELAESQALIAAALERWRQERWRPLLPTLQVFYYGGSFIGGQPVLSTAGGRNDVIGQACWELKNAGLGNLFLARETRSGYNQANLHLIEVQARVAAEVIASAKTIRILERSVQESQKGVREAEEMWRRLLAQAFGIGGPARKYDPIQPLLAERALREARLTYLREAIEYNREQFRLFWAMGQPPVQSLDKAAALPMTVPVLPPPSALPKLGPDKMPR